MRSSKKAEKGPPTWTSPEYLAECQARARTVKVRYEGGEPLECGLIHVYKRTDADVRRGPIMSASSGPKDYLGNQIIALFESDERIEQVLLLSHGAALFVVYRIGLWWLDRSKPEPRRVLVSEG